MKLLILLLAAVSLHAQGTINWDGKYELQLSDFKSEATQIGGTQLYGLHLGGGAQFSFSMTRAEFIFTKNFNAKVSNTFDPYASSITAPDEQIAGCLVAFARYGFDLSELYARKMRQKLYEEKSAFSDASFFEPVAREIEREKEQRFNRVAKLADMGRKTDVLEAEHELVRREIQDMSDFCKECKIRKKR